MTSRDDTTKPSRINRRRKKKWRMAVSDQPSQLDRLADWIKQAQNLLKPVICINKAENVRKTEFYSDSLRLTPIGSEAILYPLPVRILAGSRTPHIGQKAALIAVFLRPAIFKTGLIRLFSMVGCIGQPLKRLAGSYAGSANLIQSTAKLFASVNGGLSLHHRNTIMSQHNSAQKPTPLFNVFFHRQCLRIKRRYPACVVKFVGMEG